MNLRAVFMSLGLCATVLLSIPSSAQSPSPVSPPPIVRAVLANAVLSTVVDAPLYYRLARVDVPAGQTTTYSGANGMVYVLSGPLAVAIDGTSKVLQSGDGAYIAAGKLASFTASGPESSRFLHFLLTSEADVRGALEASPAQVTELYRTLAPLPNLKPGAYAFNLTRVTFPAHMAPNPPHYRSGGALYYVLAGTGAFTSSGTTKPRPPNTPHYEPYGLVHQWGNPGETPLTFLAANINPDGQPAVVTGDNPPR